MRAAIALLLTGATAILFATGQDVPLELLAATAGFGGFYFGNRVASTASVKPDAPFMRQVPLYKAGGSGGGAPTDAQYLVAAASGDLSAEVVATSAGLALLDDATAVAQRDTLGLAPISPMISGALAELCPRWLANANGGLLSSGRISLCSIMLPKGITITSISFASATTAMVTGSNQWFALYDSGRNLLGVTADDTSTAWGANTIKTLNLASQFVTTYAGLHYLGITVVASTVPTLAVVGVGIAVVKDAVPVIVGSCNTGLTNPASAPATASNFPTGSGALPYGYVS